MMNNKPVGQAIEARRNFFRRRSADLVQDLTASCILTATIAVLSMVLLYGYYLLIHSSYFQVRQTTIMGCKEVTEKDVLLLSGLRPRQNIFTLNTLAIKRRISANPWVRDLSIGKEFPERVIIEIKEKTPVAILKGRDAFYLIDQKGEIFKKLEEGDSYDYPFLSVGAARLKPDEKMVDRAIELIHLLSKKTDFPTMHDLSEIYLHDTLGLLLFTQEGLCLQLGSDQFEKKLKRLPLVLADLRRRIPEKSFLSIDLDDPEKITVQRSFSHSMTRPQKGKPAHKM